MAGIKYAFLSIKEFRIEVDTEKEGGGKVKWTSPSVGGRKARDQK